jgi:hypothetical protein
MNGPMPAIFLKGTFGFEPHDRGRAYLLAIPAVNQEADRDAMLQLGPANATVPIWEQMADSRTVASTANDNTPYTWFWVDLHNAPDNRRCAA